LIFDPTLYQTYSENQDKEAAFKKKRGYWHKLPTDDKKSALEKAWNSAAESGDMVEHEMETV
jgi:hypothetical protein